MSNTAQWLGYTSAVLTTSSFFPQALKTIRTNNTEAISLRMYLLFSLGVSGWAIYGLINQDGPVFWANVVTLPAILVVLERKVRAVVAASSCKREQQGKEG